MHVLGDDEVQAKKSYDCEAYVVWQKDGPQDSELTDDERLVLDSVRADKGKIRAGQRYRRVRFNDGHGIEVWRARLDMNILCSRYELFDDA